MKVIKPKHDDVCSDLEHDDDFFRVSHLIAGDDEGTLCGVSSEEWGYTNFIERKKVTCPSCLEIIKECKAYKL